MLALIWPQVVVGAGGAAFTLVGLVSAWVLVPTITRRNGSPLVIAWVSLLFVPATVAGICFLLAATRRSHEWEFAGSIILVGGYTARYALGRLLRRRDPAEMDGDATTPADEARRS